MINEIDRGQVWWANLPEAGIDSSVQGGYRPVLIVSSSYGCKTSDIVMVCPMTTKLKSFSINILVPPIFKGGPSSQVLTNQITTIKKSQLDKFQSRLSDYDLKRVYKGIQLSMGLEEPIDLSPEEPVKTKAQIELERLVKEAEQLVTKLNKAVLDVRLDETLPTTRSSVGKPTTRKRRGPQEIREFISRWESPSRDIDKILKDFNFTTYSAAYSFYRFHKDKAVYNNGKTYK